MTVQFLCCEAVVLGALAAGVGFVFGELLSRARL